MGKFARSWALAKSSWAVLRADKELLLLPVMSGILSLVVAATFLVPIALNAATTDAAGTSSFQPGPLSWVLLGAMYLVLAYVTIFFNTALICAADERMRGGDPTLASALGAASSHALDILPWAIVSATVSMVLRAVEQRAGLLGRIVAGLAGVAWSVVTFLVLPILVLEGVGVETAVKRSGELFRRTWGENLIANAGIGLLGLLALLAAVPFVILGALSGSAVLLVAALAISVVLVLGAAVVTSALSVVFQVALYRFATTGAAPGFSAPDLGGAFRPRTSALRGFGRRFLG